MISKTTNPKILDFNISILDDFPKYARHTKY